MSGAHLGSTDSQLYLYRLGIRLTDPSTVSDQDSNEFYIKEHRGPQHEARVQSPSTPGLSSLRQNGYGGQFRGRLLNQNQPKIQIQNLKPTGLEYL